MSNFPTDFDDDSTLPPVNDNLTEVGGDAINALREAVFNIEQDIGLGAAGSTSSIADRLSVSLLPDGYIKPSIIASLGFISNATGIYNADINPNAEISESKLKLDHRTADLYNYIRDLVNDINIGIGWISTVGVKLEPHLIGTIYRHTLDQIDVIADPDRYLKNKFRTFRNNTDSYQVVNDMNNELLDHQWADGSVFGTIQNVTTNNGSTYPSNYAHTASGIWLNSSRFSIIPETTQDLQALAEFLDSSSIFLYGTRIQNLYSNGISKVSRSSNLALDGYGPALVPVTPAIAYLQDTGMSSSPLDDIDTGDDIIEFKPSSADRSSHSFDEKFALVKPGDIVRINYGTIEVSFIIKEKKYISQVDPNDNKYIIRIAGKNLMHSSTTTARIDKSLVNSNKFGVLALGSAQIVNGATNALSSPALPSLTVGSPRGAMALGLGFNPDQFDSSHYNLYLALFPTGFPQDGYTILPAIDVTGNAGATPGKYTLESIVEATNRAFRHPGYNYRFIAYSYKGEFGVMLSDSYNNAAFSIVSAAVSPDGTYDATATNLNLPNNVVGVQELAATDTRAPDPLGFGANGSSIASPPYMTSYGSSAAALLPTKLFTALKRNNYYVDGTERDKLNLQTGQILDTYGDGYWTATVDGYSSFSGRLEFTYRIALNLANSDLKVGKTLVVLGPSLINSGRFVISDITVDCTDGYTFITVYDGVHATALSPTSSAQLEDGTEVAIYFNSDSVSFNQETATDFDAYTPFKRHFEVYTDSNANTFTHERGRYYVGGASISVNGIPLVAGSSYLDIVRISPKLRGYQYGSITKITLFITSFVASTGLYSGYLATTSDYITYTNLGSTVNGKIGEVTRFYDETNIDYIDFFIDLDSGQPDMTNVAIDIQLFPTLALDDQIMMIGICQVNDIFRTVSHIRDERQFGNTSEKELSTSALDFIATPQRLLNANGVIQGFDRENQADYNAGQIYLSGGTALVNGKFVQINAQTVSLPPISESNGGFFPINWAICVNDKGEYQPIPLLDKFGPEDATFGPTGSTQRIFTAYNVVNGSIYTLDAVTFANLVNVRKDLTVLYVAKTSVASGPVFTISLYDVRKYIYNQSDNIQYTWVPANSDRPDTVGHFNNAASIVAWVNMYNLPEFTVKVKGNFTTTSPSDFTKLRNRLILEGDGVQINMTGTTAFLIKDHITIRNITFNYNPTVFPTGNINGYGGCILSNPTSFDDKSSQDILIENCVFNSSTDLHPPFICFNVAPDLDANVSGYVKDVSIIGNKFNDTTDHPAAIAFLNTYQDDTNSGQPASALANILIEKNICNQNQVFYLASTFTVNGGGAGDTPGMVAFNVVIRNNKMGAVAYSTSSSINFSSSITQKEMGLTIEDNSCTTIISPIDHTGRVPTNYLSTIRADYNRFVGTGVVTIRNNNVSYISVVNRRVISSSFPATMTIANNRMYPNDYAGNVKNIFNFDASADLFVLGAGTTYGVAIYVDHTTAATSESTIDTIIEGNVISNNAYNPALNIDDSGFIKKYYEGGIFTYVPAIIRNNRIQGFAGEAKSGTDPRTFGICGHVVAAYNGGLSSNIPLYVKANNNFIYRGGDSGAQLRSYIEGCNEATDNFFDSSTCDNPLPTGNINVVVNATNGNYRNRNQIYTLNIRAQDTGRVQGANNLTFNVGVDNSLTGYLEELVAPSTTNNPYKSAVDAAAVSIDAVRYYTADTLTAGSSTDGQLHVDCSAGIKKVWVISLDEIIPLNARLYSVTTNCKISGGSGNKIATLALVSEGASGFDFCYAYGTRTVSASGLSTIQALSIDTIQFPYTNLTDITLGKSNITLVMDAIAINATFFFSNLVIKYIY